MYRTSFVAKSPIIKSPSFGSMSSVMVPAAPAVVQSSGLPSADARNWLGLDALTIQTRLFQTSIYLPFGGLPPSAAAVGVALTFTGLVPVVALLTPIAKPPNVTHCQYVSLGKVSAPVNVVCPVPFVWTMYRLVEFVNRMPTSP